MRKNKLAVLGTSTVVSFSVLFLSQNPVQGAITERGFIHFCLTDSNENEEETSDVGDVVSIAESLVGKFKNKYQLGGFDRAIKNYGKNGSVPKSASDVDDSKVIDCSTFVSLVMTMAGVDGLDPAPSSSAMATDAKGTHKSFKEVSKDKAKAGDIATSPTHVLILAEDWHGDDTQVISMGDNQGVVKGKFSTYKGASNDITFAEPVGASKGSSKNSSSSSSSSKKHKKYGIHGLKTDKDSWDKTAKSIAKAVGKAIKVKPELVYAQIYQETGGQMSPPARDNNNFTGITWSSAFPEDWKGQGRGVGEGGNYVNFPSLDDYAEVYAETLDNDFGSKKPSSVEEFATALKQKNYFTGPLEGYIAGMKTGVAKFNGLSDVIDASDTATDVEDNSGDDDCSKKGDSDTEVSGSWGWPFPDVGEGNFSGGQLFGVHPGGEFRQNGFHDGLDFGSSDHPGKEVHAVHGGKVIKIDYAGGLEWYVVTKGDDNLSIVYQEFATQKSNIKVKVGDTVETGDVIGIRDTEHLHLGITTKDFDQAVSHSFDESGGWLDPQKTIKEGIENGGSSKKGGKSSLKLSKKEEEARQFIVQHESGGNYKARNPSNPNVYGAYQLTLDKLGGDLSPAHQDEVANEYAKSRYGGWVEAMAFWKGHNWW